MGFPIPTDKQSMLDRAGRVDPTWYKFFDRLRQDASVTTGGVSIPVPEDYGAIGDGVTDDTTAMVSFFTNSSKFGMLTPGKTYLVDSDTLSIPANTFFWGDKSATVKNADADNVTIKIEANNVTLRGFSVDGGNSSSTIASGYNPGHLGISAEGLTGAYITDVWLDGLTISNCGEQGIEAVFTDRLRVTNCVVSRCGYCGIGLWSARYGIVDGNSVTNIYPGEIPGDLESNNYGIVLSAYSPAVNDTCRYVIVSNNDVSLCMWEGLDEHDSSDIWFINNRIRSCGTGIAVEHHTTGRPAARIFVRGNSIIGFGTSYTIEGVAYRSLGGVVVKGAPDDTAEQGRGLVISDNYITTSGDTRASSGSGGGISIRNYRGIQVTGNYLDACYKYGIICHNGSVDSVLYGTITGNTIDGTQTVDGVAKDVFVSTRVALQITGNFAQGNGDGFSQSGAPTFTSNFAENYLFS